MRAAVGAASAIIYDRTSPVPIDHEVALRLWFGIAFELIEALGEDNVREQLEQVISLAAHNRSAIDALDQGADAVVITHPPDCRCEHCT